MKASPILNIADAKFERHSEHGDKFDAKIAPISTQLGAKKLGYNLTSVPPGKRAFPLHNHHVNEELFFVLEGEGTLRYGDQEYPVRAGDCIACPPGGPEVAHQLVNTGSAELRYLAISTAIEADVFQYPDSGKFGVVAGRLPGMRVQEAAFGGFFDESKKLGYWDGE